ncbi:MAG: exodeoxyribonuclease VII large subunit [Candidatus Methanomethylophilaceae archaeon]|nr:exodeoxyribonuclease VII large subunit [Candidatus Methanomethylophilaceae archaeon]
MAEIITVTQLNNRAKTILGQNPSVQSIWVEGEISNLKNYNGNYYFVLKDADSQVSSVLFRSGRSRMDFEPQDSLKVSAFGSVSLYTPRGQFQFVAETMRRSGVGDLYRQFELLKAKLEKEGLFDPSRKRPLPKYPRRIGVVTSEQGAVIHDIITTSATRFPADIVLAPAQVQGEGAWKTIVHGIELLNRLGVDVIIVGRGGGSIEDLWPFNEEPVARAIAASAVPVVSAVGHETDFTIADFVADARAPTPTGASVLVLRDGKEIRDSLSAMSARVEGLLSGILDRKRSELRYLEGRIGLKQIEQELSMRELRLGSTFDRIRGLVESRMAVAKGSFKEVDSRLSPESALKDISRYLERLSSWDRIVRSQTSRACSQGRTRLSSVSDRPERAVLSVLEGYRFKTESVSAHLESVGPYSVLSRGYAIVSGGDGVLTSVRDIEIGGTINVTMRDGSVKATVQSKEEKK